ncbi:protein translocase subunit secY/sec61 alpha [Lachnospiraceae bacterium RM5]|nr:protein translocase subunit secY/sec61 alpha [Lachnospiraceae bacterium RM5]
MFKTVRDAFKVKDIRDRIFYTLLMLVVVRIGCQLPLPNTQSENIAALTKNFSEGALGFFNAMTGGSFEQMSIFALNITPYITSSIIVQLLTIAIPKLEELQKDGEDGRKTINKITRILTIVLALLQSAATAISFGNRGLFGDVSTLTKKTFIIYVVIAVAAMTASSAFLMWLGENITEKGVGNGISIILLINIVARMPEDFANLYEQFVKSATSIGGKFLAAFIIAAVVVVVVAFVVLLQSAERRIPVQYSKKMQGRRLVGGSSSHIPLKVNTAGVIPIIFAQSLLMFPVVLIQLFKGATPAWTKYLTSSSWWKFTSANAKYSVGYIVYVLLVIGFAYFYTSITFNPMEVADNMKKQGGFIPGIRPGKPTEEYLNNILTYVIFIGAIALLIIATIPIAAAGIFNADVSFGGTSLIIVVGVVLETITNIESKMVVRNYKGLLSN